ncbi:polyprenol monophosphomannose synthase [Leucobacter coleopterorum]|uniref:Polyprenol monophosphomannose synthase n=1 Tax=Leucobacter coleopterorum TaxID=2714933 RepID=A0ABX6JYF9_9MICO|nr:polyprenol monophosphomannose synthase [Leucobacter coleopterorum]QIM19263.1 polyprenol monophosphomannose synthase [Leucobacter coleopterorum]
MRERGGETLVILPTYDERSSLPTIVSALREQLPEADILIIDDSSPDGTGEIAEELAAKDSRISVLHRQGKLGLGTAYIAGFERALAGRYRFAIEMDSDGSHLTSDLPRLIAAAREGAGLVLGARWIPGGRIEHWPWYRQAISRTGTAIARISLRSNLHDLTSGFRVIDTTWLRRLDLSNVTTEGYGFQVEVAWALERMGCPVTEVPITFVERSSGRSKMSLGIVLEALAKVLLWGWQLRFGKLRA